jgi:hypothetical protein
MQQPTRHGGILTENGFNIGLSAGFTAAVRNLSCECAGNRYQMAVLAAAPYLAPITATLVTGFLYSPTDAMKPFSTAYYAGERSKLADIPSIGNRGGDQALRNA